MFKAEDNVPLGKLWDLDPDPHQNLTDPQHCFSSWLKSFFNLTFPA